MSETTTDSQSGPVTFPTARNSACPFDPPAEYVELRAREGLTSLACPVGVDARVISRYEDVRTVLGDPRLSSRAAPSTHVVVDGALDRPAPPGGFLNMDGAEHAQLRRLLTPEFTVKRIQAMRPYIKGLVDQHIDAMLASTGPVDLFRDFALPIPSLVICELLGVSYGDRDRFQAQSAVLIDTSSGPVAFERASAEITGFMTQLVIAKLAVPTDDLLGRLIARARATGQELSIPEIVTIGITLLIAGHETTANMIGLSTLALLRQPDQLAALRADPELAATAVDEMLRYLTILQFGLLRQVEDDLPLGDETIKAGEWLVAALSSGNRDESMFPDPDRIDLRRSASAHLAFGYGIHQCLGQQLARVELQEVFASLHQRIPTLRLAVPFEDIEFKQDALVYGVRALPVTWEAPDGEAAR